MVDLGLFDKPVINDRLEMAIQELDLLFNTQTTELIGNTSFGMNFLQFLWMLTPNVDALEKYIEEKIQMNTLFLRNMKHDVRIDFILLETECVYVVQISVFDSSGNKKEKQYVIKN